MKYKISWKKFKGTTKLPAQPSPSRFSAMEKEVTVAERARKKFGELPEFMGLSTKSTQKLAAESYAGKVENRMFFKTLGKESRASRLRTAGGIKGKKLKIKTPTAPSTRQQAAGIFKGSSLPKSKASLRLAKGKGAMGAYKTADVKGQQAFSSIVEKYTDKAKGSAFKMKTVAAKRPLTGFEGEKGTYTQAMRNMGLDVQGYDDRPKWSKFKKRKK
jgi:hypothetical protein